MVSGGISGPDALSTTELFPYNSPDASSWRDAGLLPSGRFGIRAAKVRDLLYVTGGLSESGYMDEVLVWDTASESWSVVDHMKTTRGHHSVTEVSLAVVVDYCSEN